MKIDLTDWAALLEALDGLTVPSPGLPPLPKAWRRAKTRAKTRARRPQPVAMAMSLSQ